MYYIPRENNTRADLLSKLVSTKKVGHLRIIIQEILQTPPIDAEEIMVGEEGKQNWMTPYKNIIIWRVLPPNKDEARRLKRKASYYSNA